MKKYIAFILIVLILSLSFNTKNKYLVVKNQKYNTENIINLSEFLKSKANGLDIENYDVGNKNEMFTFEHNQTVQTDELTDYRFIGNNPNNYVYYNCDDNGNNCEIWRIIGVFSVEDENGNIQEHVKLVRGSRLDDFYNWDELNLNNWNNSSLNYYLNNNYYDSLSKTSKEMIQKSKYYLGGLQLTNAQTDYINSLEIYTDERGNRVYDGNDNNWIGKIALMYPSDYLYTYANGVNDVCFNKPGRCERDKSIDSWIYNMRDFSINFYDMLLSASYEDSNSIFIINAGLLDNSYADDDMYFYPVLYLKNNVKVLSGDGSIDNPYKISLFEGIKTDEQIDKEEINNDDNNSNERVADMKDKVVKVDNTASYFSNILFIGSVLLLMVGIFIIIYNIIKSRKEK